MSPGDRVTVQVDKSLENVLLYLGVLRAGAVYQPLNTAYTGAEVEYFIGDAEPRVVVCRPGDKEQIEPIAAKHGCSALTLGRTGDGSLMDAVAGASDQFATVHRNGDDLAGLLYTSGTTGALQGGNAEP